MKTKQEPITHLVIEPDGISQFTNYEEALGFYNWKKHALPNVRVALVEGHVIEGG